jgi:hypothetical protein
MLSLRQAVVNLLIKQTQERPVFEEPFQPRDDLMIYELRLKQNCLMLFDNQTSIEARLGPKA